MTRRRLLLCLAISPFGALMYGCSDSTVTSSDGHTDSGTPGDRSRDFSGSLPIPSLPDVPQAAASAPPGIQPTDPVVDPLVVERLLYNLGLQSHLASRIRQDINLLALLSPNLRLYGAGEKLDRTYLASGINNKRLFESLFNHLLPYATTSDFELANEVVKAKEARAFLVDYWASIYDHKAFVEFAARRWNGSDWRRSAIQQLNTLWYLDSLQAGILRPIAPVLMDRMRMPPNAASSSMVEAATTSLAFFRTAWATRKLSDDGLYRLVQASSSPALNKVLRLVAGVTAAVCTDLARSMDSALPPDLSRLLSSPLDTLQKEAI